MEWYSILIYLAILTAVFQFASLPSSPSRGGSSSLEMAPIGGRKRGNRRKH